MATKDINWYKRNRVYDLWPVKPEDPNKNWDNCNYIIGGLSLLDVRCGGGVCTILPLPKWDAWKNSESDFGMFGCLSDSETEINGLDILELEFTPYRNINKERIIVKMPHKEVLHASCIFEDIRSYGSLVMDPHGSGEVLQSFKLLYEHDPVFGGYSMFKYWDRGSDGRIGCGFEPENWKIYERIDSKTIENKFELDSNCVFISPTGSALEGVNVALIRLNFDDEVKKGDETAIKFHKKVVPCYYTHEPKLDEWDCVKIRLKPLRDFDGKRIVFEPIKDEDNFFGYKAMSINGKLVFSPRADYGCHAYDIFSTETKFSK